MGRRKENLSGQRFGRLIVLYVSGKDKHGRTSWLCVCDCGNLKSIQEYNLRHDRTKSCGCLWIDTMKKINLKHGDARKTKLYHIWHSMRNRCNYIKNKAFRWYGQRGIRVYEEWNDSFIEFRNWAMANGYREGLAIDRIDNTGNYEPGNCRWITRSENSIKSNRERNDQKSMLAL